MSNLKIFASNIEEKALEQIHELLNQVAFADCKIRIMPDVHAGKGCVIGFTADLGDKVIPNIVGVDIGCGMLTVELGNIEFDLERLDEIIREFVPSGFNVHKERKLRYPKLQELKCYRSLKDTKRLERSIGTLGGGNHFIEIDIDNDGNKYLIIHTGSRNLGKQVAEYYQDLANQLCNYDKKNLDKKRASIIKKLKEQGKKNEIERALRELSNEHRASRNNIPKDLAYLEGIYREEYLHDMRICQEFAILNRENIAKAILFNYSTDELIPEYNSFETIHNYVDLDSNIVRKGAISAKKGELLLIPINMRDGCILGIGKGNDDWNQSAPHGAGRLMSRSQARKVVKLEEFQESMKDIYSTSVGLATLDEAPMAYKPIEAILSQIGDTVEVIRILKPIYNFKANQ